MKPALTTAIAQLTAASSPLRVTSAAPRREHPRACDLTVPELRAVLGLERDIKSANALAALDAVLEHADAILARDDRGGVPRERKNVQEIKL